MSTWSLASNLKTTLLCAGIPCFAKKDKQQTLAGKRAEKHVQKLFLFLISKNLLFYLKEDEWKFIASN